MKLQLSLSQAFMLLSACAVISLVLKQWQPSIDEGLMAVSVCFGVACYVGCAQTRGALRSFFCGAALFHGGTTLVVGGFPFPPLINLCGPYMGWMGYWWEPEPLRGAFAVVAMASGLLGGCVALCGYRSTAPETWITAPKTIYAGLSEVILLLVYIHLGILLTEVAAKWPIARTLATTTILISHQIFYLALVFAVASRRSARVYWSAFAVTFFSYLWLEGSLYWPNRYWLFPSTYLHNLYPGHESAEGVAYSLTALAIGRYTALISFALTWLYLDGGVLRRVTPHRTLKREHDDAAKPQSSSSQASLDSRPSLKEFLHRIASSCTKTR